MFEDTEDSRVKPNRLEKPNFVSMSVADLLAYISALNEEAARAAAEIEKKQAAKRAADGFFKTGA